MISALYVLEIDNIGISTSVLRLMLKIRPAVCGMKNRDKARESKETRPARICSRSIFAHKLYASVWFRRTHCESMTYPRKFSHRCKRPLRLFLANRHRLGPTFPIYLSKRADNTHRRYIHEAVAMSSCGRDPKFMCKSFLGVGSLQAPDRMMDHEILSLPGAQVLTKKIAMFHQSCE